MQIPPAETIPMPNDGNDPVPPMGPGEIMPDREDFPLEPDSPGEPPTLPPKQAPFPVKEPFSDR